MELYENHEAEMLRYWVWLTLVFGAGSQKLLSYLQTVESPMEVYEGVMAGRYRDLPPQAQKGMTEHKLGEADSIVYFCRNHNIMLLPIDSEMYPHMLRSIGTPPVLLTAAGNPELLKNPLSLSVVGTRHPSPYSEKVTTAIIGALAKQHFTIVSGFAKGIDAIAQTAALDFGGTTVSVLGCGINVNYPRENQVLRERMLSEQNGLFLSEYMPGTQPFPANFPRRNRILSGLGYATAVMEAAARSGSLVTAQCAIDQGRYLYCVPPADLFDKRYGGVIPLLRDGAIPLMSHEDILMSYYSQMPQYIAMQEDNGVRPSERLVFADANAEKAVPPDARAASQMQHSGIFPDEVRRAAVSYLAETETKKSVASDLPLPESETGSAIVQFLRDRGDTYADDIAAALDMDLSALLSELTLLELDGFVESLFGKQYRAC